MFNADVGGHYVVGDFQVWDRLDFRGFGYQIPQDALAHMTERGSDVVFDDQQVRVVLNDTTLDDILFYSILF